MDVQGDEFALTVQGQVIDAWSEPRLPRGGIGFFSAHGEGEPRALGAGDASVRHAGAAVRVSGAVQYSIDDGELGNHEQERKRDGHGACAANRGTASPSLARAVALHLEGKRKEALKELNSAIENGEETAEVFAAKGHVQFELEQYDDAMKTYEKLLAVAPRHPTANFNLGICYEKLGRWQEATEAFTKALETDPQREEAQLGLGICLLHQEKPEPAIG